ncbi:MAG: response regulator [Cyclobacteriaceae bacterium]
MKSDPKHILIVDDEWPNRMNLEILLENDYQVTCAEDGQQGLDYLQQQVFHLIITDLNMPKIDGTAFIKEAHQVTPDSKIIVLTGYDKSDEIVKLMKQGVIIQFAQKPVNIPWLIDIVHKTLKD